MQDNRTVLITGASSGIGYELAKIFAKNNYNLVLTARNREKLYELKDIIEKDFNSKIEIIEADLSEEKSAESIYNKICARSISIDVLVNNAGFGTYGNFIDTEIGKTGDMIQVNIASLVKLTKLFLPFLVDSKNGGKILNVASTAAFQPGPLMAVYYATKAFVLSFSEALAEELKNTGVTVTALCPGPTQTGFQKTAGIENVRLVKTGMVPSAYTVALYGYKAMVKGKRVAVQGFVNRLIVFLLRFAPRRLVTVVVMLLQEVTKK